MDIPYCRPAGGLNCTDVAVRDAMSVSSALIGLFLCCSTCDEILRILGFDWLLLFLQGHLHRLTVVLAMRTLLLMLGSPPVLARFREGSTSGGWLDETQSVLENRIGIALGLSMLVSTRLPPGSLFRHLFSLPLTFSFFFVSYAAASSFSLRLPFPISVFLSLLVPLPPTLPTSFLSPSSLPPPFLSPHL